MRGSVFGMLLLMPAAAQAQVLLGSAKIIDGDTVIVGGEAVRLHGIDALEESQTCKRGGEMWQCGSQAKALLASLIDGRSLTCTQRDRDIYGRLVASCKAGGLDLAGAMVEGGFAVALPKFSTAYIAMAEKARSQRVGMWDAEFELPASYRAAHPHINQRLQLPAPVYDRSITIPTATTTSRIVPADAYFRSCAAARAAGASPLYRGQPGYGSHLDRDGDGVACEPLP